MWTGLDLPTIRKDFWQHVAWGATSLDIFMDSYGIFANVWESENRLALMKLAQSKRGTQPTRYRPGTPDRSFSEEDKDAIAQHFEALLREMFPASFFPENR